MRLTPCTLTSPSTLWITEALYGIDPKPGGVDIPESEPNELVCGTYTALARRGIPAEQLIWYAWGAQLWAFRNLHGMDIGPGSQAWKAMQQCSNDSYTYGFMDGVTHAHRCCVTPSSQRYHTTTTVARSGNGRDPE